jgi:hypothetical protein
MILEAKVTTFARRLGYVSDVERSRRAAEDGAKYRWEVIRPEHYVSIHGERAYVLIATAKTIGCACPDMSHRCRVGEVCKHVIMFSNLPELPTTPVSDEIAALLRAAGWTGSNEHLCPPTKAAQAQAPSRQPPIQDPERKPTTQAETRAERRERYGGMTPEEIIAGMSDKELKTNAARGAQMAIAELERRAAAGGVD